MIIYNDLNQEVADYLSHRFDIEIEASEDGLKIETDQFCCYGTPFYKQDMLLAFVENVAVIVATEFDAYVDYEIECGLLTLFIC